MQDTKGAKKWRCRKCVIAPLILWEVVDAEDNSVCEATTQEFAKQIVSEHNRITDLEQAVIFFRSVIKSGKAWSIECERAYQYAMATEQVS